MNKTLKFYNERISLNVLANSIENAKDCYNAADGNIIIGILSKDFQRMKKQFKQYQPIKMKLIMQF